MYLPTQHGSKLVRADLAPLSLEAEQEDKVLRLLYDPAYTATYPVVVQRLLAAPNTQWAQWRLALEAINSAELLNVPASGFDRIFEAETDPRYHRTKYTVLLVGDSHAPTLAYCHETCSWVVDSWAKLVDLVDQEYSAQSGRQRCAKCGEWYDSRLDNDECLACSPNT